LAFFHKHKDFPHIYNTPLLQSAHHPIQGLKNSVANDGEIGEQFLRKFQNNERTIPTILTTSQKLSTGVDARNIRNIVLMREVSQMIEFKQMF
jgi:type I site-specific restriction endonuclease